MLGVKKHILKLTNSLVILAEAVGLKKGLEAPKKAKGLQRGPKAPQQPSARARIFGTMLQNILV